MVGYRGFPIFHSRRICLWPGVKGDDIEGLPINVYSGPSGPVSDNPVWFLSNYLFNISYWILGGYNLWIIVPPSADAPVLMSVAGSQFSPVIHKVAIFLRHCLVGVCKPYRLGFAPHADIRVLGFHEVDEPVVIVVLAIPHSVLYIPVEEPHRDGLLAAGA